MYYFYEFGLDKQLVALLATVNSGKGITVVYILKNTLNPTNPLLYVS
jgi:hypothetical protein